MIIARVTGSLHATRKNPRFEGKKILVVTPEEPDGRSAGTSFLAVDRVSAGPGDRVLVHQEGSGARLLFADEKIPLQAVIVAVIDSLQLDGEEGDEG
ncbi:MAG TPA: ethanolamine utilization protein EutN [Planctomycetes bacterium]|nr:ethanolamine utilization protein EutN [Planctomycetota bacterium]HIN81053.1 ethanolamine utilization protein EutN [Planctomycetota bacterium]